MEFKNILKELRKQKGISQEELAKHLCIARSSVANWEQGLNFPNNEVLIQIADYFNCSIDYLLGRVLCKNPKEKLEEELYLLDLSEDELDTFLYALTHKWSDDLKNTMENNPKLSLAYEKYFHILQSYIFSTEDLKNNTVKKTFDDLINSLDRRKILHKYENEEDTPEIRAIARDVAKLKPEKQELFKNLLKQLSDEADEANRK